MLGAACAPRVRRRSCRASALSVVALSIACQEPGFMRRRCASISSRTTPAIWLRRPFSSMAAEADRSVQVAAWPVALTRRVRRVME
jgi:hypothetical protein